MRERLGFESHDLLELGKISPAEAKIHGLKSAVFYVELDLTAWLERAPRPERFQALSAFPSVRRDLAVVVSAATPQTRVEEIIRQAKAPHLESVQLFDVFRDHKGEKIPADRKSLAYALTYRSPERTLVEREINEAHDLVRRKLVAELNCSFRES